MAVLLEFVVMGTPVSRGGGKTNLRRWRKAIKDAVVADWKRPPARQKLRSTMIHFHQGDMAPLDNDNMSKVVHDVLRKLVYLDDRQVIDTRAIQVAIHSSMDLEGATPILIQTLAKVEDFLYMRIDELQAPFVFPQ